MRPSANSSQRCGASSQQSPSFTATSFCCRQQQQRKLIKAERGVIAFSRSDCTFAHSPKELRQEGQRTEGQRTEASKTPQFPMAAKRKVETAFS